jgi:hypothetical protein
MRDRLGLSRSQLLMIVLLASVLVVMAFLQNQPKTIEPYDPADTSSLGLRALVLWLEQLGYPVTIGVPRTRLPDGAGLLFIHPNNTGDLTYDAGSEVETTYKWVQQGGTLVLIGPSPYTALTTRFGVEQVETLTDLVSDVRQVQPLLPDVASKWDAFYASRSLNFDAQRAVVPLLAHSNGDPVVAIQLIGEGVVWHLTEDFALTNLNLRDSRIASLLPAILRTVPAGAPVMMSTQHLSSYEAGSGQLGGVSTLQDWLYTTPFGQATLLLMVAILVYLCLQGRRLGPALPGLTASRPRQAAEYVTALAGLQRRMRQPNVVADHHRQRLKSAIGRLAQLPADLPDSEWLAQLHRTDLLSPTLLNEVTELLAGYAKIRRTQADETALVHLVQATDALLASLPRATTPLVR